jgi:ABC-type transport system substrate-binding protein
LNQTQDITGKPDVTDASWNTFATYCFGTGLFEIDTFKASEETILKVRPDCWRLNTTLTNDPNLNFVERFGDHSGGLDTLRIRIIPDQLRALFEFEAGKVDLEGITAYPEKRDEYLPLPDYEIQSETQFYIGFFGYNMRPVRPYIGSREPTKGDPNISVGLAIRKAISYAIDREEMNNIIHGGKYTITDYPIYQKMGVWCNPNIIRYNHDLEKARYYLSLIGLETVSNQGFSMIVTLSSLMVVTVTTIFIVKKKRK